MLRFNNKVVVVTGGGGGIGEATCKRFANEGAQVIVVDNDSEKSLRVSSAIKASGGKAEAITLDISDEKSCHDFVDAVIGTYRRVDVLVNNAGINKRGRLTDVTTADWAKSFDVNVHGLFYLCAAVIPYMLGSGRGGAIVNTASQWGLHPAPGHIAYNVTKAAVASFTQNLARDYAPYNIRVNAVCPGEIHTSMLEAGVKRSGGTIEALASKVPFGRLGQPEEVAALITFLASDEAPFMCGSLVEITGAQAVC